MVSEASRREMTTGQALAISLQPNAKRKRLLDAFDVLVADHASSLTEQETNYRQAPHVGPAVTALKNRLFGMTGEYANAARMILTSNPGVLSLYPDLVQQMRLPKGQRSDNGSSRPSRKEIMDCITCDGGSMDGFPDDYRDWVASRASPGDMAWVRKQLERYESLWYA